MIQHQQKIILIPYTAIYELVVPRDNILRRINELENKYCLDNGRNAISPILMFKYLLLKSIFDLSDVDVVERSKYGMSFKFFRHGSRRNCHYLRMKMQK